MGRVVGDLPRRGVGASCREMSDEDRWSLSPFHLPPGSWWTVMTRVRRRFRIGQVQAFAAGYAFYLTLSLIPASLVLLALPGTGLDLTDLSSAVAQRFPLATLPGADAYSRGLAWVTVEGRFPPRIVFVISLLAFAWCQSTAMRTSIKSVRLFFGETERVGFVRVRAHAVLGAGATMIFGVAGLGLFAVGSRAFPWLALDEQTIRVVQWVRVPAAFLAMMLYAGLVYRLSLGPRRAAAGVATVGSMVAAALWAVAASALGMLVDVLPGYGPLYAAMGGFVVLLAGFYATAYCTLLGAVINAEFERVTMVDTSVDLSLEPSHSAVFPAALDAADGEPIPLRRRHG